MLEAIGAVCFGLVLGWLTHRTVRRQGGHPRIRDLTAIVSVIGGGGVLALFQDKGLFGAYAIGLAIGFFAYFATALILDRGNLGGWMEGENTHRVARPSRPDRPSDEWTK
jgi:hypothetical protein